jgi:glycerophosphoryl diester phosphodiesterase
MGKIDIQGHRGCRGLFPENSLPAFQKAIDLGVHTLELDVVLSKDQQVVVSHEPYMSKTICLDPFGLEIDTEDTLINLYQLEYDSIKQYDCGTKFHPGYPDQKKIVTYKPLLSEVFDLVKKQGAEVKFNIEIKSVPEYYGEYIPYPQEYVNRVLGLIEAEGMLGRTIMQSFDINILEEIKKQYPNVPVAILVDENESIENKLKSLSFKPDIISPSYKLLTASSVSEYQSQGHQVIPWTVNEIRDLQMVLSWNVNGIISDYPDRLIKLLQTY